MSVAFGFLGVVKRRNPVLMSPVTGLLVGTSGFTPSAYFSRLGIPSLVATAVSAAAPLLDVVPKYWSRHDWMGARETKGETTPCTAKSAAGLLLVSKMYQVPLE